MAIDAEYANTSITFTDNGFTIDFGLNSNKDHIYIAIADSTTLFYDEATLSTVTNHTLTKRYGVDPLTTDLRKHGIYPLTEQPAWSVDAYVKEGDYYNPIRSYNTEASKVQTLEARVAELLTRIENLEALGPSLRDRTHQNKLWLLLGRRLQLLLLCRPK